MTLAQINTVVKRFSLLVIIFTFSASSSTVIEAVILDNIIML